MPRNQRIVSCMLLACFLMLGTVWGQTAQPAVPDLTKQPTLYVVPYAHLDTQWRWDYATTINTFLPDTMRMNFALFEKYPHYIFNFSGANRYRMMKEYYPSEYSKVKEYVKAGRWFPSGSSMEENDVNSPSAESIMRQILYGKQYFRGEFGKTSAEFMLPDCFGFPASLPSILAHVGIRGFSTQKLSWHSAAMVGGPDSPEKTPPGIPFNVGFWEGPDGKGVIAALNAMDYDGDVTYDISKSSPPAGPDARSTPTDWPKRVDINGKASGLFTDFYYYGTGDVGGSPREASVRLMEAILTKSKTVLPPLRRLAPDQPPPPAGEEIIVGDGPLRITQASAEQMFLDIKPDQMAGLPRYKGDLELTEHSAGSLTSQTYLKRWNRKNELLADAAEKASVAASWLGGRPYPKEQLNDAWTLVMGGQFHDIIPGTSIPKAYEYSWNDEVLAMNQFAGVLTSATQTVASGMNTQTQGTPIIVYNPLNIPREDVVEATVSFPGNTPKTVRVFGPDGEEVPAQLSAGKVLFLARVPSVGYAVYDVQAADSSLASTLQVTKSSLGNARYSVRLDHNGDVSGIFDKKLKKEILSAPARLALKLDKPVNWPAWNMDWGDQQKAPRAFVSGPARIRIVENGPVRVALEVTRKADGSKFVQTIRLSAGDAGNRVEFNNVIDWKTAESNLKAVFPLSASNPVATYNWDIGTVQRPNDNEKMFEYPSHQWFDLTDKSGAFGVTILSDCKNASDKPNDTTLQLTLLRTPGIGIGNGRSYSDQSTQDWGHHEFVYGLAGHGGDWRNEQTDWQAQRLNQPLVAFESSKHNGPIGKSFSFLKVNNPRVRVLAVKKTESPSTDDEVVVRLVELDGQSKRDVSVSFAAPITAAREINGAEEPVGTATVTNGELVTAFTPYQVRSFAVKLAAPATKVAAPRSVPVALTYDRSVASQDGTKSAPGFDTKGFALPAEMLPADIAYAGIHFKLAPAGDGKRNAMLPKGQTLTWPAGNFNRLYVLAASAEGDQKAAFHIGSKSVELTIQDWGGYIGQWDNRLWTTRQEPIQLRPSAPAPPPGTPPRMRTVMKFTGLVPGFIKQSPVAWFSSHQHTADGVNMPYAYSYLFAYSIDVPEDARTLTLPDNEKIRILAISLAYESGELRPAQPLFDTLERPQR
jgi:alpha-mannosidase